MGVYLVTWDINRAKHNYAEARKRLISHLERYPHIKDPGLDSVWFAESGATADAISADLQTRLDNSDRVIVTKLVAGQHQGWLNSDVWKWINARI